jgi:DNA-binding NarL/FixJ family response regulator
VVAKGDGLLSPSVTRRLIAEFAGGGSRAGRRLSSDKLTDLTEREREILTLVGGGLTNAEIAARLFISPATAKTHVSRVMSKLDARYRAQLVVVAYESGLVTPGVSPITTVLDLSHASGPQTARRSPSHDPQRASSLPSS